MKYLLKRSVFIFLLLSLYSIFITPNASAQRASGSDYTELKVQDNNEVRNVNLSVGKSVQIELNDDVKDVVVANPKVAEAVVRSIRSIFIIGIADGGTTIFAIDAKGRRIAKFDVTVGRDLDILRHTLREALPKAQITVQPAGLSVLLTGTVESAGEAAQAADIANAFIGVMTNGLKGGVINALTIRGKDQIMIKVSIAEIQRTILKQLGIENNGIWKIGNVDFASAMQGVYSTAPPPNALGMYSPQYPNTETSQMSQRISSFTVRALEQSGLMRTLAEPTLTAISGETASFLVGGEVPIVTSYECTNNICQQGYTYKAYGVSLTFTPIVMSEGRISLRIATEVSEIDPTNSSTNLAGATVPSFKVRRSETTVELPSGGTLVIAGLIQQKGRNTIAGVPGLKNLPILGSLFRSRDFQKEETELMISATPYIAQPIMPNAVARPDDGFVEASDPQGVLLGRFNKIYGSKPGTSKANAKSTIKLQARPGFIND